MSLINSLFSETIKIQQLTVEGLGAQDYPDAGSFIPVRGLHRFAFLVGVGAVDSELTLKIQQANAVDGTPKDLSEDPDTIVVNASAGDNKWYILECEVGQLDMNNGYDHVLIDVAGAAGADDVGAIFFLGYGNRVPVTQGDDFGGASITVG